MLGNFVECFNVETNNCVVTPVCGLRHVLADGMEVFLSYLDGFTIADLIGSRARFSRVLDSGSGLKVQGRIQATPG